MYKLPAGYHHQQYKNTGSNRSEILGFTPQSKIDIAETHQNKAS
jgi:hypothetical protein